MKPEEITQELLATELQTKNAKDPDLIIRTSGEYRLSNFMLWQAAYSELYITKVLWPDFDETELMKAFVHYASRERRFGKTTAQVNQQPKKVALGPMPMLKVLTQ